jgi:FtsZ-binding cell division protein ZapB
MEKQEFIYFVLGAGSLFVGLLVQPYMKMGWQWLKSQISHRFPPKPAIDATAVINLQQQIDELKEQMNNVAKNAYRRETNRKNNVRREVREYLNELKTK